MSKSRRLARQREHAADLRAQDQADLAEFDRLGFFDSDEADLPRPAREWSAADIRRIETEGLIQVPDGDLVDYRDVFAGVVRLRQMADDLERQAVYVGRSRGESWPALAGYAGGGEALAKTLSRRYPEAGKRPA